MLDSHLLSNLDGWPRLAREPRLDRGLDRRNLSFVNGYRNLAHSDDEGNPGDHKNWEPIQWVEAAEDVPREKWAFDFLEPVRPPAPTQVQRQKRFIAHTGQVGCDDILEPTSDLYCKPWIAHFARFLHPLQIASQHTDVVW